MRMIFLTAVAGLSLVACQKQATPPPDANMTDMNAQLNADMNAMGADADMNAATPAALTANETSWEFTDPKSKKLITESIDASGKYIANAGKEHFDHGTAAVKDGKMCFTSAMDKMGEVCWTDPNLAVGQSGETTNDKGEKLTVKRIAYTPLTM